MIVDVAVAVSVASALLVLVEGVRAYPLLPARMPLRFGLSGSPDGYGPKAAFAAIFAAIAFTVCAASLCYALAAVPGTRIGAVGMAAVLVFTAFAQHEVIEATMRGTSLPTRRFWTAFVALLAFASSIEIVFH